MDRAQLHPRCHAARARGRLSSLSHSLNGDPPTTGSNDRPAAQLSKEEHLLRVIEAIEDLPDDLRDVCVLRGIEDLPFRDVGQRLPGPLSILVEQKPRTR